MTTVLRWTGRVVVGLVLLALATVARPLWLFDGPMSTLIVSGHSMDGTYRTGDLILTSRHAGYGVGDVVGFRVPEGEAGEGMTVIHRIVGARGDRFVTQGDNNPDLDPWTIGAEDIQGASVVRVPGGGTAGMLLRGPIGLAGVFGSLAAWVALGALPKRPEAPATTAGRGDEPTPLGGPVRRRRAAT